MFDGCANGQSLKRSAIIGEFTQEYVAIDVTGSIRSKCAIEVLARLFSEHGASCYLGSDNRPEFVSRAILERLAGERIEIALIDLDNPWRNRVDASFNGKRRDGCLSMEGFRKLKAGVVIEFRRRHSINFPRHSSLKDRASFRTPSPPQNRSIY